MSRRRQTTVGILAAALVAGLGSGSAPAQDWNPFRETNETARPPRRSTTAATSPLPAPMTPMAGVAGGPRGWRDQPPPAVVEEPAASPVYPGSAGAVPRATTSAGKIERFELEPTNAVDGSGLPVDAWRGLDVKAVEQQFATLPIPPRSAALHGLWQRLLTADVDPAEGGSTPSHFEAIRLEALYRSGLVAAMSKRLESVPPGDPVFTAFAIRRDLALGQRAEACAATKTLVAQRSLPTAMVGELRLLTGYCAAADGDTGGAGLAADLARDEGIDAPLALSALDALSGNGKAGFAPPKLVRMLDYRLLELLGPIDPSQIMDKAEPVLVAAIAAQETAEPRVRVLAGEAAARLHAINAEQLGTVYRTVSDGANDPALRRAESMRVISAEPAPGRKLQLMRAALDDAHKAGLLDPTARLLAPMLAGVLPSPELRGPAETAIEILLLAGDYRRARDFVAATQTWHWLPLLDIAEAGPSEGQREQNLGSLDELVRRGRLPSNLLHRLATVLDATDVNVPIPLWEAASRTPQPATGYLPETGVLAQLQDAAKRKDVARTVLLAMRAMGPGTADSAHIIALGDTIRALRRAGLETDARRLGVEALIGAWPRGGAS